MAKKKEKAQGDVKEKTDEGGREGDEEPSKAVLPSSNNEVTPVQPAVIADATQAGDARGDRTGSRDTNGVTGIKHSAAAASPAMEDDHSPTTMTTHANINHSGRGTPPQNNANVTTDADIDDAVNANAVTPAATPSTLSAKLPAVTVSVAGGQMRVSEAEGEAEETPEMEAPSPRRAVDAVILRIVVIFDEFAFESEEFLRTVFEVRPCVSGFIPLSILIEVL